MQTSLVPATNALHAHVITTLICTQFLISPCFTSAYTLRHYPPFHGPPFVVWCYLSFLRRCSPSLFRLFRPSFSRFLSRSAHVHITLSLHVIMLTIPRTFAVMWAAMATEKCFLFCSFISTTHRQPRFQHKHKHYAIIIVSAASTNTISVLYQRPSQTVADDRWEIYNIRNRFLRIRR